MRIFDSFDNWFDKKFPTTKSKAKDRVFFIASKLGDHSYVWVFFAIIFTRSLRNLMILLALILLQSLVTNGPIKYIFRRQRPTGLLQGEQKLPFKVRKPITSSMPSGHAASSFFSILMFGSLNPLTLILVIPTALIVSYSRIYTTLHHPSDVFVGVIWGSVFGCICLLISF
jgi:undecaprenyl-diphosphatase